MNLENRYCTLCGPQAPKQVKYKANFSEEDFNRLTFSARRSPDRKHFQLVECTDCGIIYSDPASYSSELAGLYDKSLVSYDTQESEIYHSYSPVLDRGLKKLQNRGTFVEVGGGSGFMLKYGVERGFKEQIEIEPSRDAENKFNRVRLTQSDNKLNSEKLLSPEIKFNSENSSPSKNLSSKFICSIFEPGILPPQSASLICFFQVLDHIPNPRAFLEAVHKTLEPGGIAVCVTHNTRALSALLLGERSPIIDIEHTYLFNLKNIAALFKSTGFAQVETFSIPNRYSVKHWLNLAPLPSGIKSPLSSAFKKTGFEKLPIKVYAGNLAVIAQKAHS